MASTFQRCFHFIVVLTWHWKHNDDRLSFVDERKSGGIQQEACIATYIVLRRRSTKLGYICSAVVLCLPLSTTSSQWCLRIYPEAYMSATWPSDDWQSCCTPNWRYKSDRSKSSKVHLLAQLATMSPKVFRKWRQIKRPYKQYLDGNFRTLAKFSIGQLLYVNRQPPFFLPI